MTKGKIAQGDMTEVVKAGQAMFGALQVPQTLDAAQKALHESWKKHIEPLIKRFDEETKVILKPVVEWFDKGAQYTRSAFDEMGKALAQSTNPVVVKCREFLKSADELLRSFGAKGEKALEEAWKGVSTSVAALKTTIERALGTDKAQEQKGR